MRPSPACGRRQRRGRLRPSSGTCLPPPFARRDGSTRRSSSSSGRSASTLGTWTPGYNLGTTLLARNRPADAIPHLRRVVSTNPHDAGALADLGAAYGMTGRFDQAVGALEASLRLAPDNAQAHFNLGLIAARQGQARAATRHFEEALRLDPSNRETAAALAEARAAGEPPIRSAVDWGPRWP